MLLVMYMAPVNGSRYPTPAYIPLTLISATVSVLLVRARSCPIPPRYALAVRWSSCWSSLVRPSSRTPPVLYSTKTCLVLLPIPCLLLLHMLLATEATIGWLLSFTLAVRQSLLCPRSGFPSLVALSLVRKSLQEYLFKVPATLPFPLNYFCSILGWHSVLFRKSSFCPCPIVS